MTALGPASAPSALMRLEFHLHCAPTGGGGSIAGREMDACIAVGMTGWEKLVREPDPPVIAIAIISRGGGDSSGGGGVNSRRSPCCTGASDCSAASNSSRAPWEGDAGMTAGDLPDGDNRILQVFSNLC